MPQVQRFGVSIPTPLLYKFDRLLARKGYQNRSEALRDLVRDYLAVEEAQKQKGSVLGTVTLVYDHDITNLSDRLTELQHKYHAAIVSSLHIHLSRTLCMEVVIVQGRYTKVKEVADHLIALKGVRHGKLVFTPKEPSSQR